MLMNLLIRGMTLELLGLVTTKIKNLLLVERMKDGLLGFTLESFEA
jgi:hypothetical protein